MNGYELLAALKKLTPEQLQLKVFSQVNFTDSDDCGSDVEREVYEIAQRVEVNTESITIVGS